MNHEPFAFSITSLSNSYFMTSTYLAKTCNVSDHTPTSPRVIGNHGFRMRAYAGMYVFLAPPSLPNHPAQSKHPLRLPSWSINPPNNTPPNSPDPSSPSTPSTTSPTHASPCQAPCAPSSPTHLYPARPTSGRRRQQRRGPCGTARGRTGADQRDPSRRGRCSLGCGGKGREGRSRSACGSRRPARPWVGWCWSVLGRRRGRLVLRGLFK